MRLNHLNLSTLNLTLSAVLSNLRPDAWQDPLLVELTDTAEFREAGFQLPLFCTAQVQHLFIKWTQRDNRRQTYQDVAGRRWDVLYMLSRALVYRQRRARAGLVPELSSGDVLSFTFYAVPRDGVSEEAQAHTLECHCYDCPSGIPMLIITMPGEAVPYLKPALSTVRA